MQTNNVEYLVEVAKINGIAAVTVDDGIVIAVTKKKLQALIEDLDSSGNDFYAIFVKDVSDKEVVLQ